MFPPLTSRAHKDALTNQNPDFILVPGFLLSYPCSLLSPLSPWAFFTAKTFNWGFVQAKVSLSSIAKWKESHSAYSIPVINQDRLWREYYYASQSLGSHLPHSELCGDLSSICIIGEGNDNPLQYSCLENPHGRRSLVGLQSVGSQRVGHDWATSLHLLYHKIYFKSTPISLLNFVLSNKLGIWELYICFF